MAATALKLKREPEMKMFHATVHVTRLEEWCVGAESVEEARELLMRGAGHRCHIGDCLSLDVERVDN